MEAGGRGMTEAETRGLWPQPRDTWSPREPPRSWERWTDRPWGLGGSVAVRHLNFNPGQQTQTQASRTVRVSSSAALSTPHPPAWGTLSQQPWDRDTHTVLTSRHVSQVLNQSGGKGADVNQIVLLTLGGGAGDAGPWPGARLSPRGASPAWLQRPAPGTLWARRAERRAVVAALHQLQEDKEPGLLSGMTESTADASMARTHTLPPSRGRHPGSILDLGKALL